MDLTEQLQRRYEFENENIENDSDDTICIIEVNLICLFINYENSNL